MSDEWNKNYCSNYQHDMYFIPYINASGNVYVIILSNFEGNNQIWVSGH